MLVDQLELALQQLGDTEQELEGAKRKLGEAKHGREEVAPHLGDAKWKLCKAEQGCEDELRCAHTTFPKITVCRGQKVAAMPSTTGKREGKGDAGVSLPTSASGWQ
ncbi:hypothetical protein B296_00030810 [Ensete ventricosum]|uniref:Uncharacterized protein n=1 Tax=Ensete ventricosum TaxID=4639 RepID=A0A427AI47_ENSVE|nr:hypothetical protein B296_00030810 [Ensete ventricosum]